MPASSSSSLPSVALSCGVRHHFYFAIGSMCNPVSLLLRGIQPVPGCSVAAILRGYRLAFHGEAGMADIQSVPAVDRVAGEVEAAHGSCYADHFHGVLHLISDSHLAVLDRIEAGYRRIVVGVELYDGSTQAAYAYQMYDTPQLQRHGLPSERYVDIISRGCQHYNVCSEYVQWLQSLPCVPRPQPSQLMCLPLPVKPRLFTLSELALCDGEDGREVCIAVNGKVLQYVGEPDDPVPAACRSSSSPSSPFSAYAHMKAEYAGRDVTYLLSLMCYEPLFPVAPCAAQMSQQHKTRIEDMYVRRLACLASFAFEVVGTLVDEPADSHRQRESAVTPDENADISVCVSSALPISPRSMAGASGVLLNGRRIDEFKARRRRGSLTSTIMQNVQRIISMHSQASNTGDSESDDGEEHFHYRDSTTRNDSGAPPPDVVAVRAVVVAELKSLSHSPVSGVSVASSTATTVVSLHDFYNSHSPLGSPLSPFDDATDNDEDERNQGSDEEMSE